jgi:hypothetical protein
MSSYEETFWRMAPGRGARAPRAGSKHHELQSIARSIAFSSLLLWLPTKHRLSLPWGIRPNHCTLRFQGYGIHHHFYAGWTKILSKFSTLTLLSSSDHDPPSHWLEPTPLIWGNERLFGSLYLAKAARANPALSIAITQSSLRGYQQFRAQEVRYFLIPG